MNAYAQLEAQRSAARDKALSILSALVDVGEQRQNTLLKHVLSMGIVDKLIDPRTMHYGIREEDKKLGLFYMGEKEPKKRLTHPHALRQMAGVAEIALSYVNKLNVESPAWRLQLLAHNLNELFHQEVYLDRKRQSARYLHRLVNDEVRGFLTRSYNRKLSTLNLLRPFIETASMYGAKASSIGFNDVRCSLKCMLPIVFEPIKDEFVAFGVTFSNSDFGAGKLRVSGTCMRIQTGGEAVLKDELSRVHIGSLIQDSDLELSEETEDLELRTYQSAVRDTVSILLKPESVDKALQLVQKAHELEIPWYKLRQTLASTLQKTELELLKKLLDKTSDEVVDLPPVATDKATAWWAANALGYLASKQNDEERRSAIQVAAGQLLES